MGGNGGKVGRTVARTTPYYLQCQLGIIARSKFTNLNPVTMYGFINLVGLRVVKFSDSMSS